VPLATGLGVQVEESRVLEAAALWQHENPYHR